MPKRSYSTSTHMSTSLDTPPAKVQKTERSHEENQERAYIAASRRADRSLEARVQSAKLASDIHRKRTGRRLRVSEDIVLREEMYEEMEDEIPRPYKYLTAHLQTDSDELNNRVGAYVMSHTAMAAAAKYNEINKVFNQTFPRAGSFSQQMPHSIYMSPLINNRFIPSPRPGSVSCPGSRNHSISTPSYSSEMSKSISNPSPSNTPTTASAMTPNPSPTAASIESMDHPSTPYQMPQSTMSNFPLDPELAQLPQQPGTSFTSQLPHEIRVMANIDMNDPMAMHFFGESTPPFHAPYDGGIPSLDQFDFGQMDNPAQSKSSTDFNELLFPSLDVSTDFSDGPPPENFCQSGTLACGGPGVDGWESFIDFDGEK
ncbi:hypothetical protein GGS21DRAFT_165072 [Xylaria nigripes]|nr:hypothetical protein GGS21DRAFT_165072 [Xylaria nigripes]